MSVALPQQRYHWPVLIAPLAVLLFAVIVSREAGWLEQEIFQRLILAFGANTSVSESKFALNQSANSWGNLYVVIEGAIIFAFACAATWCGFRLPTVPRAGAVVQLFVLSLLVQWAMWHFGQFAGHSLGFFTAIFVGCLAGYGLRILDKQRQKSESQYYEILLRNRELQETKLQLVKQDEVERRMLAADLHDQVLNDLKAIVHKFDKYTSEPDQEMATSIRSLLNQAMGEIREVMDSLCPSALEHLGLAAAIEDCLRRGSERAGFKSRFRSKLNEDDISSFSMVEKSLLYRLVQESITNVCKHAEATIVRATIEKEDDHLVIRVADDGKGVDPAKMRSDSRGLRYMRQRADLIGATITWRPGDKGKGTTVEIRMDLNGRQNDQSSGS